MSKANTEKPSAREDNSPLRTLGDEDELRAEANPMLQHYLDEGQAGVTDRLVHGHPLSKKTRVKKLKKIVKDIERTLAKPNNEQTAGSNEEADTTVGREEAAAAAGSETWHQDDWNCPSWSTYGTK